MTNVSMASMIFCSEFAKRVHKAHCETKLPPRSQAENMSLEVQVPDRLETMVSKQLDVLSPSSVTALGVSWRPSRCTYVR